MRCIECGAQLAISTEPMSMVFRGEDLMILNIEHYLCPECGEIVFDSQMNAEYNRAVDREYRRRSGLLLPEEIRSFRESLDLTQEQFQTLLGVGKLSVCRWETGRLPQPKTADNLIRAYMSCPRLVNEALERAELVAGLNRKRVSTQMYCVGLDEYVAVPAITKKVEESDQCCAPEIPVLNEFGELASDEIPEWLGAKKSAASKREGAAA